MKMNVQENFKNLIEGVKAKEKNAIMTLVSLCLSLLLAILPFFGWVKASTSYLGKSQSESRNWFNGELQDTAKAVDKGGLATFITIFLIIGMIACVAYIVMCVLGIDKKNFVLVGAAAFMLFAVIFSMIVTGDINSKMGGSAYGISVSVSSTLAVYLALIFALVNGAIGALFIKDEKAVTAA